MTDTPQQIPVEIRHRFDNSIIYSTTTAKTKAEALIEAVAAKKCLWSADLSNLILPYGARLDGASLDGARLDGASLDGASLVGASLDGAGKITAHASVFAFAGPVGVSRRIVYAFLAAPNEQHAKPWLVLRCGCFIGDEKAYGLRIQERYGRGADEPNALYLSECKAALVAVKAMAATWPKPKSEKKTAKKTAKK